MVKFEFGTLDIYGNLVGLNSGRVTSTPSHYSIFYEIVNLINGYPPRWDSFLGGKYEDF